MKQLLILSVFVVLLSIISCKKDKAGSESGANTLNFAGQKITFNSLSIDDNAPNTTSQYILTTTSNVSVVFYCKYVSSAIQTGAVGEVTYTADAVSFTPVNNYPMLTVRGYINYNSSTYNTVSGKIKITREATGNQTIRFIDFKVRNGTDEQSLNGTVNLPKS